jgi:hypothetical protein
MFPKLKTLLLIGIVEILALVVVRNLQSGDVQFMGYYAFPIGNRKVLVKPPPGMQLLTTPAEIKKRLQVDQLAFALVGDSSHSDIPSLKADYFLAGEYDDLAKLLTLLEQDTSAILVLKNIEGDRLTTIHSVQQEGYDSLFYVISRITKCYPYYLRVRSSWYGSRSVPHSIEQGLEAMEVRR